MRRKGSGRLRRVALFATNCNRVSGPSPDCQENPEERKTKERKTKTKKRKMETEKSRKKKRITNNKRITLTKKTRKGKTKKGNEGDNGKDLSFEF